MSDPNFNNALRDLVATTVGYTPVIGDFVALLTSTLWPDNSPSLLDQVEEYVDTKMKQLIDQSKVDAFRSSINALQYKLQDAGKATSDRERFERFQDVIDESNTIRGTLSDDHGNLQPVATLLPGSLPYFITFGTVRLSVKLYEYVNYEKIYGTNENPAQTLQDLLDEINAFSSVAYDFPREILNSRKKYITKVESKQYISANEYNTRWEVKDTFINYSRVYNENDFITGGKHERLNAIVSYEGLIADVETEFSADVDALVAAASYWYTFNPALANDPVSRRPVYTFNTLSNGLGEATKEFDDKMYFERFGAINSITIWGGDWIDGIEVFYGLNRVSGGLHGRRGGSPTTINISEGEVITGIGGTVGDWMVAFWIKTNLRRDPIGAHGPPGNKDNFTHPYNGTDPVSGSQLAYFRGRAGDTRVAQLRVAWVRYVDMSIK
ncbi:hypothetical protein CHU98_g3210 [Xylaria longipes]|nr:hypothetical protein CHU98_g3210 [Xylaria longipes]